ncbi:MAG: winged helix-turn-helix transcriptional regulator [Sphingomonadaceae bacterium]
MREESGLDPMQRPGIVALLQQMDENGHRRDEPVREVMGMTGDRWSSLILLVLATGVWRHAELRRALIQISAEGAISQRVLTLKLRALERSGFVHRHATDDVPPHVSYDLTDMGQGLVAELRRMIGWIGSRRGKIERARAAFDAREDDRF